VYDTLSTGKVIARNLPGEILQVPVDENETYLRTQFSTSDNRNYRDGDKASSRKFGVKLEKEEDPEDRMYNSPVQEWDGSRKVDDDDSRTTMINNEVRVYKGGSWKDRDYWLDPAQRRYFPQEMATDYIGFRCAMSRVGSKTKQPKRARH
jgi:gliding motility-associated lipoprotein GldJ